jgi:hypothetical protein
MKHRFTIEQLKKLDDKTFLTMLIQERESQCTNPLAPLTKRLRATSLRLQKGDLTGYTQAKLRNGF